MRIDLNDYAYYAAVVTHGGFAAAARALREPKSKLSRRVAALEARLGLRLIERSTRRFRVTEAGEAFYARCRAMLLEAEQADALAAEAHGEPQGRVRFSCPTGLVEMVSNSLVDFLARFPRIRLQLVATDRRVDLIAERIDVALRVRSELTSDASLTMRALGTSTRILVASPVLASGIDSLDRLASHSILATSDDDDDIIWPLETRDGDTRQIAVEPRFGCADLAAVREAAIAGLGIAFLPDHLCQSALADGRLVHVLPELRGQPGIVHLVFTTRRGLPPAVRALIDHLAASFPRTAFSA